MIDDNHLWDDEVHVINSSFNYYFNTINFSINPMINVRIELKRLILIFLLIKNSMQ